MSTKNVTQKYPQDLDRSLMDRKVCIAIMRHMSSYSKMCPNRHWMTWARLPFYENTYWGAWLTMNQAIKIREFIHKLEKNAHVYWQTNFEESAEKAKYCMILTCFDHDQNENVLTFFREQVMGV